MSEINFLKHRISSLLTNPSYSDITLTSASGTSFLARRTILTAYTPFFDSATSAASGFSESITNTVSFPEHGDNAVKALLDFCYSREYRYISTSGNDKATVEDSKALHDFEVYKLADYILSKDLKYFTSVRFKKHLDEASDKKETWEKEMPALVAAVWEHGEEAMKVMLMDAVVNGIYAGRDWRVFNEVGGRYREFGVRVMGEYIVEMGGCVKGEEDTEEDGIPLGKPGPGRHGNPTPKYFNCERRWWYSDSMTASVVTCGNCQVKVRLR